METPRKFKNQQLVSPSLQCSSAPVGFGQGFLTKYNVVTLEYPPYSPDLSPSDFFTCSLDRNQYSRDDTFVMLLR